MSTYARGPKPAIKDGRNADELNRAILARMIERFPRLQLSYGYIGGCHSWGDDRSWRFFTNLKDNTGRSVSYWVPQDESNNPRVIDEEHVVQCLTRYEALRAQGVMREAF